MARRADAKACDVATRLSVIARASRPIGVLEAAVALCMERESRGAGVDVRSADLVLLRRSVATDWLAAAVRCATFRRSSPTAWEVAVRCAPMARARRPREVEVASLATRYCRPETSRATGVLAAAMRLPVWRLAVAKAVELRATCRRFDLASVARDVLLAAFEAIMPRRSLAIGVQAAAALQPRKTLAASDATAVELASATRPTVDLRSAIDVEVAAFATGWRALARWPAGVAIREIRLLGVLTSAARAETVREILATLMIARPAEATGVEDRLHPWL